MILSPALRYTGHRQPANRCRGTWTRPWGSCVSLTEREASYYLHHWSLPFSQISEFEATADLNTVLPLANDCTQHVIYE
jgi:hypothetical protein